MRQGAVAAIYFGDRLCEFPLGVLGLAVAVAIFPLLSRHAGRGDYRQLGADMTVGLRLVFCLAVPAGVGLFLLAEPITRLLFQRGHFHPADTIRAARTVAWYAAGVWAYCESAVIVRGFYALNDFRTPVRVGAWVVGLNLLLNLTLIWPFAEAGLAMSTAVSAAVQVLLLLVIFSRRRAPLVWRSLAAMAIRTALSTVAMAAVVQLAMWAPLPTSDRLAGQLLRVGVPLAAGMAAYGAVYLLLGGRELSMLLSGNIDDQ
jgi:putative peptidoglycan lipid II flippase